MPSGPALLAVTVYVVDPPGETVVTPSFLVIERSAVGAGDPSVSESVPELLAGFGSVVPLGGATVAVFDNVPTAAAAMAQFAV
jgi:hypothetical protein